MHLMDYILFFLLLSLSIAFSAEAQQRQFNISLGSSLSPTSSNSSWLSSSGLFAFGFFQQDDGYAVGIFMAGIPQKTVVWTANRDNLQVSNDVTLLFTNDGRLLLRSAQGQDTYITNPSEPASSASMLNSGNFVLYNSDGAIIWQSFQNPTDTLLPGQFLSAGSELFSSVSESDQSRGIFRLKMQSDGNLVQYPIGTTDTAPYSYWASGTDGRGDNVTLRLENDGFLYLINGTGSYMRNLTQGGYPTNNIIYVMRLNADGIFRLYSNNLRQNGNQTIIWESSSNKCDPKGLCGLNGFCVTNDQDINCRCLPGFAPVKQGNWTSGCERNFTAESCKSENGRIDYTIQAVANIVWEEASYTSQSLLTREDCEKSCLDDCNCEAATFQDRTCRKQRLPLRFGRRNLGNSNIVLIKVGRPLSSSVSEPKGNKEFQKDILIVSIILAAIGLTIAAISGIAIYRSRIWKYKRISYNGNGGLSEYITPRSFTYAELETMTNGFKDEIGKGAFGTVYKGIISDRLTTIAVKRLHNVSEQGEREFRTEVSIIGQTHHRNLVQLLGYCIDGPVRLLVYPYMSNGSLADLLFSTTEEQLSWEERMEFARNIARGILYLHEECETQIIHCDIKPQNILIDEARCPKISDFGLAKLLKPDQTKTFTAIRGTRGYVAPEWHKKLAITVKADVYSYGVVLLELIACRRSVDFSLSEKEAILEEWTYDCFESGELHQLVGDKEVDKRQLERMVKLALWCIQDEPSLRPTMKKVLLMLEGTVDIPVPPSPTSFLSAI